MTVQVKVQPDVTLPSLSTEVPHREYKFLSALRELALYSDVMRAEENLGHMEELTLAVDAADADEASTFNLSDECFKVSVVAFKTALDKAMDGRILPIAWAPKILRWYHAFSKSETLKQD